MVVSEARAVQGQYNLLLQLQQKVVLRVENRGMISVSE